MNDLKKFLGKNHFMMVNYDGFKHLPLFPSHELRCKYNEFNVETAI